MTGPSTLPGRAQRALGRKSRLLFHWNARDLSLTPITGQVPTFVRATAGGFVRGSDGFLRNAVHSQPRFEWYDLDGDGIFETPGILFEGQRENGFTKSTELDDAAWTKARSSVSANAIEAPDGTTTADKLVEDGTASSSHLFTRNTPALTDDTQQSWSVFAKAAERSEIELALKQKDGTEVTVWFNLSAGTVGTADGGVVGLIEKHADGWHRCMMIVDSANGGTTPTAQVRLGSGSETSVYNGDGVSGVYIWGMQFEVDKEFPSSFILTAASTVVRNDDALTYTLSWLGDAITEALDDLTVYARLPRPLHADATGTLPITGIMQLANPGTFARIRFNDATRQITASILGDSGAEESVAVNIPAGNVIEFVTQVANIRTGGTVRTDVGGGFTSLSTAADPGVAWGNQVLDVGQIQGATRRLFGAIIELKIARGLRTFKQMQEAY